MDALHTIMNALKSGKIYGKTEHGRMGDYFWWNVIKSGPFIRYRNFGQSSVGCNLEDLVWVIEVIFKTTPEKFLEKYECIDSWAV